MKLSYTKADFLAFRYKTCIPARTSRIPSVETRLCEYQFRLKEGKDDTHSFQQFIVLSVSLTTQMQRDKPPMGWGLNRTTTASLESASIRKRMKGMATIELSLDDDTDCRNTETDPALINRYSIYGCWQNKWRMKSHSLRYVTTPHDLGVRQRYCQNTLSPLQVMWNQYELSDFVWFTARYKNAIELPPSEWFGEVRRFLNYHSRLNITMRFGRELMASGLNQVLWIYKMSFKAGIGVHR